MLYAFSYPLMIYSVHKCFLFELGLGFGRERGAVVVKIQEVFAGLKENGSTFNMIHL